MNWGGQHFEQTWFSSIFFFWYTTIWVLKSGCFQLTLSGRYHAMIIMEIIRCVIGIGRVKTVPKNIFAEVKKIKRWSQYVWGKGCIVNVAWKFSRAALQTLTADSLSPSSFSTPNSQLNLKMRQMECCVTPATWTPATPFFLFGKTKHKMEQNLETYNFGLKDACLKIMRGKNCNICSNCKIYLFKL